MKLFHIIMTIVWLIITAACISFLAIAIYRNNPDGMKHGLWTSALATGTFATLAKSF
jgi:hypothetical protein